MARKSKDIAEGIGGALLMTAGFLLPFLISRYRTWGATDEEVKQSLPGDDLVPNSKGDYTHAVTIQAPAVDVWPWLAQIGQGRGGFYSYEWLENLVGSRIKNADRIIPEFQNLKVGDSIRIHPQGGCPYRVAGIDPGRVLILGMRIDKVAGSAPEILGTAPKKYQNSSWVFFLDELDEGTTRLISRSRNDWNRSLSNALIFGFLGPISFVMDRKMLLGIKHRAESVNRLADRKVVTGLAASGT